MTRSQPWCLTARRCPRGHGAQRPHTVELSSSVSGPRSRTLHPAFECRNDTSVIVAPRTSQRHGWSYKEHDAVATARRRAGLVVGRVPSADPPGSRTPEDTTVSGDSHMKSKELRGLQAFRRVDAWFAEHPRSNFVELTRRNAWPHALRHGAERSSHNAADVPQLFEFDVRFDGHRLILPWGAEINRSQNSP